MGKISSGLKILLCSCIKLYQWLIGPIIGPCCRFHPSCSNYALLAIKEHGSCKGLGLTCLRLLRCHPWCDGGFDPVLPKKEKC